MSMRAVAIGLLVLWAASVAGCNGATSAVLAPVVTGIHPSADTSALSAVLAEAATKEGLLASSGLKRLAGRLDAQLQIMAVSGPTATPDLYPTDQSRWAYWLNARTAWSMKLALLADCAPTPPAAAMQRRFRLDGRVMSLAAIDELLLAQARGAGEFRLAACAPGAVVDDAPLPQRAYATEDFPAGLNTALSRLVLDERRFVVDVAARKVRLGPMLWAVRAGVVGQYHRDYGGRDATLLTALRPYVNDAARRRLEQCLGYEAVPAGRRGELALPGRKSFYPGRVGRVRR